MLAKSLTTWTRWRCSQRLRGHHVCVVKDNMDMVSEKSPTMLTQTRPRRHTNTDTQTQTRKLWRLLTDFKGTIMWKKVLGCVYKPNRNYFKRWKPLYLKKNLRVCVVDDLANTIFELCDRISSWKMKKVRKTIFVCLYGD